MNRPPRGRTTEEYQFRRTYQACIPCRQRKAKCEVTDENQPCKRCQAKQLHCRYPTKRPWQRNPSTTTSDTNVLRIWNACRFVRMGWFTASEALLLIDRFFTHMCPQSPILTSFYANPAHHYWLITQEPMLCCVILLISSRYHHLPGSAGSSRSYFIHHRLWQHCQHLILRITLGQEKLSKAKTRHLGSIEALLLLSEWYPRSLHFPPESDGWDADLMLTNPDDRDPPLDEDDVPMSDRWRADVVEPSRRSDRMSWMLLSSALALAHERGVFYGKPSRARDVTGPDAEMYLAHLEVRRQRLPGLLFVFVNGLAARIGCTSLMPEFGGISTCIPDAGWTALMHTWVELTKLTKEITDSVMANGMVDVAMLDGWREKLRLLKESHNDSLLHIEHQYLRVFTNSLGIQIIVEQVLSHPQSQPIDASFIARARQLNLTPAQYEYIEEVIDGAGAILTHIVQETQPLQYLPIRVFHRVISSSICLLKALALGVKTAKLEQSLQLLDRAIAAFQARPLDDIHLISRYATLLETHVEQLRQTFARVNVPTTDHQNESINEGMWDVPSDWSDWLSLPFDPLMAPFGEWDGQELDLDAAFWDLDFIWNLPP
ncbi:hypothetical protein ASPWEDRAFT_172903 [Aspergillus wentii DTO 134E9]|uniref:Zn(2)-C6 fungal-type domain-containing protein n=1 Tax=Aspergillus wentii DTO 134E9 TaxID=1073089 RepID=A0A1L9RMQ8_ASPWE|nr:uncharacterized protein ASPWEDRAFT_172903 [Aspergillus wentii DTO 134E9]OJJ36117.1 hypothetical protein ASPWEDRAFT_172903 [Aspergillus wentii DTO 134E9]